MRFGLLGPLEVWTSDGRPVQIPEAKVRALLAALLIDAGRVVPADRLIEDLWGHDLPANPAGALQTRVSQLRRALEDSEAGGRALVVFRAAGYLLDVAPEAVDVARFQQAVLDARRDEDPVARARRLEEGMALWRGPALSDFSDLHFARSAADRLEEQRLTAVEDQAEARLEAGEGERLADGLAELASRHPLRERLRAAHMSALYRAGRQREALLSYEALREQLAEELGVDPGPQLTALHQAILQQDPTLAPAEAAPAARPRPRSDLPATPGELVGREADLDAVQELLATHRVVTLTGPGGVGKTRLALEAARICTDTFPDGARLVELAGLAGSGRADGAIAEVVAATLDIREGAATAGLQPPITPPALLDRIAESLRGRRLLLLLDNCEHVIEAVAEFTAALLRAGPHVRVLATSRESLGIAGEHLWAVPPLDLPQAPEDLGSSSAARLFVQRAQAVAPGFSPDESDAEAITAICRRLDGIPLALELAATRVRALGVRQLARRLDDRFAVLGSGRRDAPGRQQTLRAVIDWSWDLLGARERAVLARIAVHADGCDLEAVQAVCAPLALTDDDVMDTIARLVDQSLVMVSDRGTAPRYRLLESVAAYGRERLAESGDDFADARLRHLRHFTELVEQAEPLLRGPRQRERLVVLDGEQANLRAALEHARAHGLSEEALRLAVSLAWYWVLRGKLVEGHRSLGVALSTGGTRANVDCGGETAAALRHAATLWRSALGVKLGREAFSLHHSPDSPPRDPAYLPAIARAEWFLAFSLTGMGDRVVGEEILERTLGVFRAAGDQWGTAATLATLARYALLRSDLDRVLEYGERSMALFTELDEGWGRTLATHALGTHAEIVGDYDRASRQHAEGLRSAEELTLWTEASDKLSAQGRIALLRGDHDLSLELHQRARNLAAEHGHVLGVENADLGLGLTARRSGDLDGAEAHLEPWLEWQRSMDSHFGEALILAELGFVAELRGQPEPARSRHSDGLAAARVGGDPRAIAMALEGLAGADSLAGDHVGAAKLLGCAAALRESVGAPLPDGERGDLDRITARIRSALGEQELAALHAAGHGTEPEAMLRELDANQRPRTGPQPI
ncbi:putative ATPase/DNA-binding SARP family transcriptional activator [Lipingzhangella halophila]|uniref:Putative ATPase/DNA-binding SARP family transcriptional activator n=1 Tax=Lipingzhangella halophila TaxID=1783352 RepID=A0A7W7RJS6_9ACTN|nr:BTAD domain-containing putative transcriptional regulator [Lipingzhangella halophila]MBB4932786.1 putative ATPase/DNA-binding SARP family transcriptional activator [Lipingzhangella halophila]